MAIKLKGIAVAGACLTALACSGAGGSLVGASGGAPDTGGSQSAGGSSQSAGGSSQSAGGSSQSAGGSGGGGPSCALPSGLAAMPSSFAVPAPRCGSEFSSDASSSGSLSYGVLDLVSDNRPDLVVFDDACDAAVGRARWDVYRWSENGFAATPASFAIPAARCNTPFTEPANDAGSVTYQTLRLVSPVRPDLVVTRDACDQTVGQSHWDVYPPSPSGFAATPSAFNLPAARCNSAFTSTASDSGGTSYATLALVSSQPDLVVTRDACDTSVGATHWDVYPWSASGFSAKPEPFALPAPRCNVHFDATADAFGDVTYALLDLVSNGHPDLVVTHDACDASVGKTHWDVYPWIASGFSAKPEPFALPAPRCNVSFDDTASAAGALTYATVDLASNGKLDLVVTHDACDASVGQTHWDVYPALSSGFTPKPIPFALPAPRCNSAFTSSAQDTGNLVYFASNLATACGPNLVVTSDACDASVGRSHWDVYEPAK